MAENMNNETEDEFEFLVTRAKYHQKRLEEGEVPSKKKTQKKIFIKICFLW